MNYQEAFYYIERVIRNIDPGEAQQALEKAMQTLDYCIEMGLTGDED